MGRQSWQAIFLYRLGKIWVLKKLGKFRNYLKSSLGNRIASKCTGQKAGKSESCPFGAAPSGSSGMEQELLQGKEETVCGEHRSTVSDLPGENRKRFSWKSRKRRIRIISLCILTSRLHLVFVIRFSKPQVFKAGSPLCCRCILINSSVLKLISFWETDLMQKYNRG